MSGGGEDPMNQYMLPGQYGGQYGLGQGVGQYGGGITIAPNITVVGGSDNKVSSKDGLNNGIPELTQSGGSNPIFEPNNSTSNSGGKIDFKNFVIKKTE